MISRLTFAYPLSVEYLIKANLDEARRQGILMLFQTCPGNELGKDTARTNDHCWCERGWGPAPGIPTGLCLYPEVKDCSCSRWAPPRVSQRVQIRVQGQTRSCDSIGILFLISLGTLFLSPTGLLDLGEPWPKVTIIKVIASKP